MVLLEPLLDALPYVLAGIGVYAILCWIFDNFRSTVEILFALIRPLFQPDERKTLAERFGEWAVITGATDGIGKQYALELASRGMNIVLISRTESKLVQVANEIEKLHPVKTKWIKADLSQPREVLPHIEKQLAGIPVGILVNNAGRMYDFPADFVDAPEDTLWDILNINVAAVTMLTRTIGPQMRERGRGAIVNISSGSELQPLPYTNVYGASKIFIKNFTLALRHEMQPFGVTVQLVTPMFVQTKMNEYSTTVMAGNVFCPDVESYTRSAVLTLGKTHKTTGYWSHAIQYCFFKMAPEAIRIVVGAKMNLKFREEYFTQLKEKEKEKAN